MTDNIYTHKHLTAAEAEAVRAWGFDHIRVTDAAVKRARYVMRHRVNPLRDCAASRAFARRIVDGGTR